MPQLTKAWVDRSPNKEKDYIIWDDTIAGFGCRIYPSKKTFVYMYRSPISKKASCIKIGVYGSVTVDEARIQAKKFAHSVQIEKIDPKEMKKAKEVEVQQSILFKDFLTIFLDKYPKQAKWKPSTSKRNQSRINGHILPFFANMPIADIKRKDILEFSDIFHKNKTKNKKCLDLLSSMFKQAALWEYMPSHGNPCDSVHKDADRKMEEFLREEDLARIEKILLEKETKSLPSIINAIRLLIYTGCRSGEILQLKWENVDFKTHCLRLNDSKTGKRTIPLNESAMKVLYNTQKTEGNPYVFCGKKPGTHLNTVHRNWKSICKEANISPLRIHDIRHSFASFMIMSGVNIFELSKLLGHADIKTTMRYAHLTDQSLIEVTNKGGKMFETNNKYFAHAA